MERSQRGQGVAKRLMGYVLEYAKKISASCVELEVSEFNEEAIAFYEALGMKTRSWRMELMLEPPKQP
ncbi:GNAT family N-acetyltransferase [Paenibacillus sp. IB182493]|uniref:GNAT family N-acetyltransferase n=1 Tax=Paenibacillus arenilitoris TaxID=2772299 RepID=A0A927CMD3_9BACL|nr:GNAT family N-acetyltransferase [Paenibacillus arenilitoris]